ncbi:ABC transporter substrate-binding protein [Leptolyngbya sp. Heron Island J]|uniref:ABC transporter substrate-binding protein n=1 Tax=Leptolyngbya sp. Heron Island J TaxID=1385935 RepID=UPI000402759A|nr:iron-siderophore ABC transporter substrate-binding protein [Leptolyngbya sp. Heron Island J]
MRKQSSNFRPLFRKLASYRSQICFVVERLMQWQIKRANRLLLLLLTVAIIAACNGRVVNQSKMSKPEPLSNNCRVIKHVMGESCVPDAPQRVVTIVHHMLGHTLAVDVKPVGSNVRYLQQTEGDYLDTQTYMGDATEGIELTGVENQANIEKIVSLEPDLILALEDSENIYSQLSQIAPTVLFQLEDIVIDWKKGFALVAELFGKEDQAQQALDKYSQRIEDLKASLGDRYQNQTISVAGMAGPDMFAYTQNSFSGSILSDLGLDQPEAQKVDAPYGAIYNLSEESLEQTVDGDVLFFLAFAEDREATFRELQQRPLWNQLRSVQKGQAYLVDNYVWTGSNVLAANAVLDDLYKYLIDSPSPDI